MSHSIRKNTLMILLFAGATAVLAYSLRPTQLSRLESSANAGQVMPRTVSLIETSTDSTGAKVKVRHVRYIRDDGSMATVTQVLKPQSDEIIYENRELIFSDHLIVLLTPEVRAKSTRRAKPERFAQSIVAMRRDPEKECVGNLGGQDLRKTASEELMGYEQVGGYAALRVLTKGSPEVEAWYAPGLGCELIRQVTRYKRFDTTSSRWITGESVKALESIEIGPPRQDIFTIPGDFEEVKPSELNARIGRMLSGDDRCCSKSSSDDFLDRIYLEQRP